VRIDKAGRDDEASSINGFYGIFRNAADLNDPAIGDSEICGEARRSSAVDDGAPLMTMSYAIA
jgi:hypothetical protein